MGSMKKVVDSSINIQDQSFFLMLKLPLEKYWKSQNVWVQIILGRSGTCEDFWCLFRVLEEETSYETMPTLLSVEILNIGGTSTDSNLTNK